MSDVQSWNFWQGRQRGYHDLKAMLLLSVPLEKNYSEQEKHADNLPPTLPEHDARDIGKMAMDGFASVFHWTTILLQWVIKLRWANHHSHSSSRFHDKPTTKRDNETMVSFKESQLLFSWKDISGDDKLSIAVNFISAHYKVFSAGLIHSTEYDEKMGLSRPLLPRNISLLHRKGNDRYSRDESEKYKERQSMQHSSSLLQLPHKSSTTSMPKLFQLAYACASTVKITDDPTTKSLSLQDGRKEKGTVSTSIESKSNDKSQTLPKVSLTSGQRQQQQKYLNAVYATFIDELSRCEDATLACQILDILSILSSTEPNLTLKTLKMSWESLRTVYTTCPNSSLSFSKICTSFSSTLRCFSPWQGCIPCLPDAFSRIANNSNVFQNPAVKGDITLEDMAVHSLLKSMSNSSRAFEQCEVMKHLLLTYWGLSTRMNGQEENLYKDMNIFLESLQSVLCSVNTGTDSSQSKMKENSTMTKSSRSRKIGMQCDGRIHGKNKESAKCSESHIPSLSGRSFPVFFELLLKMIICSFALSTPTTKKANKSTIELDIIDSSMGKVRANNPFRHLQNLMVLFGELLGLFASKYKLFPQRVVLIVIKACTLMVKVCDHQLQNCVQWRNSQPLKPKATSKCSPGDLASVEFLQLIIDCMASNCIGKVALFCQSLQRQSQGGKSLDVCTTESFTRALGGSVDLVGKSWEFASHFRAVSTLMLRCEKLADSLQSTALSHDLSSPRIFERKCKVMSTREEAPINDCGSDKSAQTRRKSRKEKKERRSIPYTMFNKSMNDNGAEDSECEIQNENFSENDSKESTANDSVADDESISFASSDSDSDSDSFGAVGDWGKKDDRKNLLPLELERDKV
uniref:Uncharacterized protein n=1 Tax=Ditylum brightwellii TaxID=49249 RepID=A0A7S4QSS0_9STRA